MKKIKKTKHCCDQMTRYLDDQRINVHYSGRLREYNIALIGSMAKQRLIYCPWCGKKLPKSLRSVYIEILKKEHSMEDIFENNVPKEFKTDEWWKKRKL